jgi:hypothetical protein
MTPRAGGETVAGMPEITTSELAQLLAHLRKSSRKDRDELLTDFLVRTYPTKVTQDN